MKNTKELNNLIDQFISFDKDSKTLRSRIKNIEGTLRLFNKVSKELDSFIERHKRRCREKYRNTRPKYIYISDSKVLSLYDTFIKHFFTYLSVTYMLEQQTENLIKNYDLYHTILEKFSQFIKSNGERLFLFGLRNYFTHTDVFPINISVRYSKIMKDDCFTNRFMRSGIIEVDKTKYRRLLKSYDFVNNKIEQSPLIRQSGKNKEMHENLCRFIQNEKGFQIDVCKIIKLHSNSFPTLISEVLQFYYDFDPKISELDELVKKIRGLQAKVIKKVSDEKY